MGDLTKNISRHEVACKCGCGLDSIDFKTVIIVQSVCDFFASCLDVSKVYLSISSGSRCELRNISEKGSRNSRHMKSRAIDFDIMEVSPRDIQTYLLEKYSGKYGIGIYSSFTHFDTRSGFSARWKSE